jgi:DNA-binding CsgD family transcriptional regulator
MTAPTQPAGLDLTGVLTRLSEFGPPSEIRARAPHLAGSALGFNRVLLSSINGRHLVAEGLYVAGDEPPKLLATLQERAVPLEYPLVEGEVVRRRRPQLISVATEDASRRCAFYDILGWSDYVAAPVVLDGQVIGLIHADGKSSGEPLDESDALRLGPFALCFAVIYERAVLRHRLRVERDEMRRVASWADARTGELTDRTVTLHGDGETASNDSGRGGVTTDLALRDLLTRRELDVVRLMVRGQTNAGIARDLVLSEGTIKFHVKNILRKLHAANRAEATSRYLRLTLKGSSTSPP